MRQSMFAFLSLLILTVASWAEDPTVTVLDLPGVTTAATSYSFTVRYADDGAVDDSSIDDTDIRITGPAGFDAPAFFVKEEMIRSTINVTYSITPPGGSWDSADDGTYTAVMQAKQVLDGLGNSVK